MVLINMDNPSGQRRDDETLPETETETESESESGKVENSVAINSPRKIVLGIIDATNIKCTNLNRKRRWDQAPVSIDTLPTEKKPCIDHTNSVHQNELHIDNIAEGDKEETVSVISNPPFEEGAGNEPTGQASFLSSSQDPSSLETKTPESIELPHDSSTKSSIDRRIKLHDDAQIDEIIIKDRTKIVEIIHSDISSETSSDQINVGTCKKDLNRSSTSLLESNGHSQTAGRGTHKSGQSCEVVAPSIEKEEMKSEPYIELADKFCKEGETVEVSSSPVGSVPSTRPKSIEHPQVPLDVNSENAVTLSLNGSKDVYFGESSSKNIRTTSVSQDECLQPPTSTSDGNIIVSKYKIARNESRITTNLSGKVECDKNLSIVEKSESLIAHQETQVLDVSSSSSDKNNLEESNLVGSFNPLQDDSGKSSHKTALSKDKEDCKPIAEEESSSSDSKGNNSELLSSESNISIQETMIVVDSDNELMRYNEESSKIVEIGSDPDDLDEAEIIDSELEKESVDILGQNSINMSSADNVDPAVMEIIFGIPPSKPLTVAKTEEAYPTLQSPKPNVEDVGSKKTVDRVGVGKPKEIREEVKKKNIKGVTSKIVENKKRKFENTNKVGEGNLCSDILANVSEEVKRVKTTHNIGSPEKSVSIAIERKSGSCNISLVGNMYDSDESEQLDDSNEPLVDSGEGEDISSTKMGENKLMEVIGSAGSGVSSVCLGGKEETSEIDSTAKKCEIGRTSIFIESDSAVGGTIDEKKELKNNSDTSMNKLATAAIDRVGMIQEENDETAESEADKFHDEKEDSQEGAVGLTSQEKKVVSKVMKETNDNFVEQDENNEEKSLTVSCDVRKENELLETDLESKKSRSISNIMEIPKSIEETDVQHTKVKTGEKEELKELSIDAVITEKKVKEAIILEEDNNINEEVEICKDVVETTETKDTLNKEDLPENKGDTGITDVLMVAECAAKNICETDVENRDMNQTIVETREDVKEETKTEKANTTEAGTELVVTPDTELEEGKDPTVVHAEEVKGVKVQNEGATLKERVITKNEEDKILHTGEPLLAIEILNKVTETNFEDEVVVEEEKQDIADVIVESEILDKDVNVDKMEEKQVMQVEIEVEKKTNDEPSQVEKKIVENIPEMKIDEEIVMDTKTCGNEILPMYDLNTLEKPESKTLGKEIILEDSGIEESENGEKGKLMGHIDKLVDVVNRSNIKIEDVLCDNKIVKGEDIEVLEFVESTEISEAVEEAEISKSVEETEMSVSAEETEISVSVEEKEISKPVEEREIAGLAEGAEISESVKEREVAEPVEGAELLKPVEEREVSEPSKPVEEREVSEPSKPVEERELAELMEETEISESVEETEVSEPMKEAEILESVAETEILQAVKSSEISGTVERPEVSQVVESPQKTQAVEDKKISKSVEETEISPTEEEIEISELVEGTEISQDETETEMSKIVEDTEISQVLEDTEISQVVEDTEISQVVEDTEISQVVEDTEISQVEVETEMSEVMENAEISPTGEEIEISELVEGTEISQIMEDTEISLVMEDTEISQSMEDTEIAPVMEDTEISQSMEDTEIAPVMEDTEVSQVLEDTEVSQVVEDTEIPQGLEDTEVSEALEDTEISEVQENTEILQVMEDSEISQDVEDTEISQDVEGTEISPIIEEVEIEGEESKEKTVSVPEVKQRKDKDLNKHDIEEEPGITVKWETLQEENVKLENLSNKGELDIKEMVIEESVGIEKLAGDVIQENKIKQRDEKLKNDTLGEQSEIKPSKKEVIEKVKSDIENSSISSGQIKSIDDKRFKVETDEAIVEMETEDVTINCQTEEDIHVESHEFMLDNTEIVTVDPNKPLMSEDSIDMISETKPFPTAMEQVNSIATDTEVKHTKQMPKNSENENSKTDELQNKTCFIDVQKKENIDDNKLETTTHMQSKKSLNVGEVSLIEDSVEAVKGTGDEGKIIRPMKVILTSNSEKNSKISVNQVRAENEDKKVSSIKYDEIKIEEEPNLSVKPIDTVSEEKRNIPLLTTVNRQLGQGSDSSRSKVVETSVKSVDTFAVSKPQMIETAVPKLEPITLRIFKDNLNIRTEGPDSPKRNRSPKSTPELKSQLSPHVKIADSKSSLSPQSKQLEFTLKIAKDATTNIPKATMSPKSGLSPSNNSTWKSSDFSRVEKILKDSNVSITPVSPTSSSPDPKMNKITLKLSKDGGHPEIKPQGEVIRLSSSDSSSSPEIVMEKIISPPEKRVKPDNEQTQVQVKEETLKVEPEYKLTEHVPSKEKEIEEMSTPKNVLVNNKEPPTTSHKKRGRPRKVIVANAEPLGVSGNSETSDGSQSMFPVPLFDLTGDNTDGDQDGNGSDDANTPNRPMRSCRGRTKPIVVRTRKPRGGGIVRGGIVRGGTRARGGKSQLATDMENLSAYELAELAKIEARREKLKQDRIAKRDAKKAKVLAKKLKDEERRKRIAREKAEAQALQMFEEETRMSAPDNSRAHTPGPGEYGEESQGSISNTLTNNHNKKGRMEIPLDLECKEVRVDQLAEYQWQGSELFMIQEQISLYLGVKSFKRKYPDLKRRQVEAEERTFLEESGLVPKSMCDLGLTAVSSAEVLDIMFHDFPDKYEEFRKHVREKQAKEAIYKQKAALASSLKQGEKLKIEPREQAIESAAAWNANLNRERKEDRRCAVDLQTFNVHYPRSRHQSMTKPAPKLGNYPVSLLPGQFCDYYKKFTSPELMYFPVNTVLYGPMRPNEMHLIGSEASQTDDSDSSSSDDSSGSSSESEGSNHHDESRKCRACNGTKKHNKQGNPEVLIQCGQCKNAVHPTCQDLTVEMVPHIKKYNWQCTDCKTCIQCKDPANEDKMLFCDLCDRGYHIYCVGLHKVPEGRWHCTECSVCSSCGTKEPGGSEWQHEFKKGDKGVKTYFRTFCVPCSKLWKKGKYCQICLKCHSLKPEEEPDLQQCNTCDRWIHKECLSGRVGVANKIINNGFQCDLCQERVQSAINNSAASRPVIKV